VDLVRLSEEHGVMDVPADAEIRVGDRLVIIPNHVCPTINLAQAVTVVESGQVTERWPVAARGMVQ
jgi:D-serine deaminase-like pyridoxal phosphate-dependent protein